MIHYQLITKFANRWAFVSNSNALRCDVVFCVVRFALIWRAQMQYRIQFSELFVYLKQGH